jgi:hypothetical protein
MAEVRLTGERTPDIADKSWIWSKSIWTARLNACDAATIVLIAALVVMALCTFRDYAISNDEGVQYRYGELIIAYYTSGFADQSVFHFQNLYLYGGLFDIVICVISFVR